MNRLMRLLAGTGVVAMLLAAIAWNAQHIDRVATTGDVPKALRSLALPFVENRGQADSRVAYYAPTSAGTAFVTRDGLLVLAIPGNGQGAGEASGWALVERPVGKSSSPRGFEASPTRVNVFPARGRKQAADVPTYLSVALGSPWPGVQVVYRAQGDNVERLFTLAPGTDVHSVDMELRGALSLTIDDGALVAQTGVGAVSLSRPIAYQDVGGKRRRVAVEYRVHGREYGFKLGKYDHGAPVTIDPFIQSTYLAASSSVNAIALDAHGDVYVSGSTEGSSFPGITGGAITSPASPPDAYVAKFSGDLKTLIQATYLGSLGNASGNVSLAISPTSGDVYVAGSTASSSFPGLSGGAVSSFGANSVPGQFLFAQEGFVAALTPDLKTLIQSTYVGGSGDNGVSGIAFNGSGALYVSGWTTSSDLPALSGGAESTCDTTSASAFVSELSTDLKSFVQSTCFATQTGGATAAIAIDAAGDVYVGSDTWATSIPGTTGAFGPNASSGVTSMFIAKFSGDLKTLDQSSFLGGGLKVDGTAGQSLIALTASGSGNLYALAQVQNIVFPGIAGGAFASDPTDSLFSTGAVAEISGDLKTLVQSTYLGGDKGDVPLAFTLGSNGNIYVAGQLGFSSSSFPGTAGGLEPSQPGGLATVSELSSDLRTLVQSTFVGGSGADGLDCIAAGPSSSLYLGGGTLSNDFPATGGGAVATASASGVGVLTQVSEDLQAGQSLITVQAGTPVLASGGGGIQIPLTVSNGAPPGSQPATNIRLTFTVPTAGVTFGNNILDNPLVTCNLNGDCAISFLDSGASTNLEIFFFVNNSVTSGSGTVTVSADQTLAAGSTSSLTLDIGSGTGSTGGAAGGGGSSGGKSGGGALGVLALSGLMGLAGLRRRRVGQPRPG